MALATKFRIQGTSDVFGQITVNIQLNDYVGSIIDLDGAGRDWIRLKIGDNSSEMSSPILAGKLTFSFYVTDDFQTTEIGKSEVYTYYVEVLDENLDQIWAGWAMPEEYTEAYHNTPYVATVVASDGLQELKNANYPLQDGKATLFTHLQTCLISTFVNNNIFESVNIYSNGMNSTASDSPFKQAQVTYNSFRSISETPKAYEVLSSLLVPFFARIYQYRGWRIENILEKRSSYVVREYDITGTFVSQSTFNPLVKFDTDYGTFKAFIQKSGQLSIRPALNNAEVYFNTVEPVEPTTTGGFQDADDWNSTTELKDWTVVAGGGANQITIEQVPSQFESNEFAVRIPGRKTTLEQTDYIESDPVNITTADYEAINIDFAHWASWPTPVLLGTKPILYFEVIFTETSSSDSYNWTGAEWVLIPLGQPRRRLRIDFNQRAKWTRYSLSVDAVPSTGTIKFRFYKLIKSGSEGVTQLRLTAWKTNLITVQPTNASLLLEAGTTNVFTQYKGPSFPHIISDGTVLNSAGVMDVANTLTATWARRGVTESLNIRRLFLTQWLSFNSRPTEILSGVIHQKGEVITPMSVIKDKDAVSSTRYVMQSYEISLGTGIGSASYREIVMEDANINAFQEFLDSIRLGDFFATTVNYNIFIGGAPGLSPGANPGQIDLNFNLNGDVRGGLNQAEITPAAIQNKARLDLTGLTADDIVLGAVKDSPDQENMTNLRLSDIKPLITPGVGAGVSLDSLNQIQLGNDGAGVVDISDRDIFEEGFVIKDNGVNSGNRFSLLENEFNLELYEVDPIGGDSELFLDWGSSIFRAKITYFPIEGGDKIQTISIGSNGKGGGIRNPFLMIITDEINSKGFEYTADYSANWTDHSLVTKSWVLGQVSGTAHNPVTIGSPANGLSISGTQALTIGLASTSDNGALSSTDWNTFNNKLNLTSPITGYTVGANTALTDTDTILQAFGKVQGQINARLSGTIASGQVAFGTGVNTVGGDAGFRYTSGSGIILDGDIQLTGTQRVSTTTGNLSLGSDGGNGNIFLTPNGTGKITMFTTTTRGHLNIFKNSPTVTETDAAITIESTQVSGANSPLLMMGSSVDLNYSFIYGIRRGNSLAGTLIINGAGGLVGIGTTAPTNLLDVNGTARIRTISNLGSAATSVLVPSATGVVSLRTLAELASDGGIVTESTQTVSTSGTINDLVVTSTNVIFTGATVTLTGIVALADNREVNIINRTGSNMTLSYLSTSSAVANRFFFPSTIAPNGILQIKYSSTQTSWILKTGHFFGTNQTGFFTNNQIGIFKSNYGANIGLSVRNPAAAGFSIQLRNNADTLDILTAGDTHVNINRLGVGYTNRPDTSIGSRPPAGAFGFSYLWDNQSGSNIGSIEKNGDIVSQRHFYFGAPNWFDSLPANTRGLIRGIGTTTANTLLLEDSSGTDNAQFLDNGQILFLRLPTSSAGLAAGSLWNNGGVLNIV